MCQKSRAENERRFFGVIKRKESLTHDVIVEVLDGRESEDADEGDCGGHWGQGGHLGNALERRESVVINVSLTFLGHMDQLDFNLDSQFIYIFWAFVHWIKRSICSINSQYMLYSRYSQSRMISI